MKREKFLEYLIEKDISFEVGEWDIIIDNQGAVDLESLTTLPEGIQFNNHGNVYLGRLTTLPEGIQFNNHGNVYLESLTTLPEGIQFNNQGNVYLESLTTLPEGIQFNNHGNVDLGRLTTLPEGIQFNNHGNVYLGSLTTLPEGIQFNNQGNVYLGSLTTLPYIKDGQILYNKRSNTKLVDGHLMEVIFQKSITDIIVYNTRYVGSGIASYIAEKDQYTAHGETIRDAIDDLRFKIESVNFNLSELIEKIKAVDKVTITDYRLITGACRQGCKEFLKSVGKSDVTEMPIKQAIDLVKGQYGSSRFIEALS